MAQEAIYGKPVGVFIEVAPDWRLMVRIEPEAAQMLMASKKERILKQYPPRQAANGSWYVNIRFAPGPNGRKVIRKGSKETLEKAIIEFVGENLKPKEKKGTHLRLSI